MKFYYICYLSLALLVNCQRQDDPRIDIVRRGVFTASIIETGELQAINSRIIVMPWFGWAHGRLKLIKLIDEGTPVKAGDFLGEVETLGILKILREKENELESARADSRKMAITHSTTLKQIEGQLSAAEASLHLVNIQSEKLKFESAKKQAINKLNLEKAQLALENAKKHYEDEQVRQEYENRIQKLKLLQLENDIQSAELALPKARLIAPIDGILEYKRNPRNNDKIRVGDQFWPGQPIAGIPDLSRMKVKTSVNETDITKINIGQKVIVRLDAFPKISFPGEIKEISKICYQKKNDFSVNVFDVIIHLERSDPILHPGMTVGCEIIIAKLDAVLYVRNSFIQQDSSGYYLFAKEGIHFKKTAVRLRAANNKFSVIEGNVKEGQKIALMQEKMP